MDSRRTFLHHLESVINDGVTRKDRHTGDWKCLAVMIGGPPRQIQEVIYPEQSGEVRLRTNQLVDSMPPRKTSSELFG